MSALLRILLCVSLFFLTLFSVQAQNKSFFSKDSEGDYQNKFKIDFLQLPNGELPFIYERKFIPELSAEIGFGFTFHDAIYDVYQKIKDGNPNNKILAARVQWSYLMGARYQPFIRKAGWKKHLYFGLLYRYKRYRWTQQTEFYVPKDNIKYLGRVNSYRGLHDFMLQAGYQFTIWDRVVVDGFVAFGVRQKKAVGGHTEDDPYVNGNVVLIQQAFEEIKPSFMIGGRVGLGF